MPISLYSLTLVLELAEQKYQNQLSIFIPLHYFVRAFSLSLLYSFVAVVVVVVFVGRGNDLIIDRPKAMNDRPELHRNGMVFFLTATTQCALQ